MPSRGNQKYKVIIPVSSRSGPSQEELSAAEILCEHFGCDIEIIPKGLLKSADFYIDGVFWELKSPTGDGKRNIQHQFSRGLKQSQRIIIDGRKSKIPTERLLRELNRQFKISKGLVDLILITKTGRVIAFSR